MMPRKLFLHGRLRKAFGGPFEFILNTPADAIRAMCANFPEFAAEIQKGAYRLIVGARKTGEDVDPELLEFGLPSKKTVHIVPVATGRKGGGTGKLIMGGALFAVAMIGGLATGGLAAPIFGAGSGLFSGITWGGIAIFGAAMAMAGVAQMLTPTPKAPNVANFESQKDSPSFLLGNNTNTIEQGHPIPICLGKIRTGGLVISGGVSVERIPV